MPSALKPWCTAITNLLQFWELCVCILFTCNDFILNCFFLSSWQPFILFQLQLINPWPLGRLFWYLTLTWVKSAVLPTHSISAILYACQFLLYLQSFMPVTVTVQPPWGIPLHHFYDNVNGVVLMINTQAFYQTFHEHRGSTQQWRSPGSEISISELQSPPLLWQLQLLSKLPAHSLSSLIK